ncbi:MAG: iron-containing alcohol dehydrogenase [Faecalibacterium sp.]|jgi:alcohol dehydrogenase class IV|nr:iron-containing alcohol dehydrogenase [Faecalibacterium sp.]
MNLIQKAYCRFYQGCMRLALPFLPYREPTLIDGIAAVPKVLEKAGIQKVLLVTGPHIYASGLTAPLEAALAGAGIGCAVYNKTVSNPTDADVEAARALYLASKSQALIAFGGGSPMDCAKVVGARIARPDVPVAKMGGLLHIRKPLVPLIAVPTTAGTGSETTVAAVITDAKTHHKYAINDFVLIPPYAVLAPEVTFGLPPLLTATTGMDALTHAVEAYIGRSTTPETRAAATEAVRLIFENLPFACADGQNRLARANMLRASYLAGTAFTKSYVGYVHAIAHSLGGKYGVAHGMANAILLPTVLEAYGSAVWGSLAALARAAGLCEEDVSDEAAAAAFIAAVRRLNADWNIPAAFDVLKPADIPALARTAAHEANPLYPVPVLWDASQLEAVYRRVLKDA